MERVFTKSVLAEKLEKEINEVLPDIVDYINTESTSVTIFLTRTLSGVEDSQLTDIVNNHVPTYNGYKIWEMVGYENPITKSPKNVNFSLLPLAVKKTYKRGEEDVFTYYREATLEPNGSITYSDPILRATWTWTHDPLNFPVYAEEKVEWYLQDGSIGEHNKIVPHYFDGLHKIRKGKSARSTLIDNLQLPVSEMIIYNETVRRATEESNPSYQLTAQEMDDAIQIGRVFLTTFQPQFNAFIEHRDLNIVTTITNDTTQAFLDWVNPYSPPNTIRDYILSEIGY